MTIDPLQPGPRDSWTTAGYQSGGTVTPKKCARAHFAGHPRKQSVLPFAAYRAAPAQMHCRAATRRREYPGVGTEIPGVPLDEQSDEEEDRPQRRVGVRGFYQPWSP